MSRAAAAAPLLAMLLANCGGMGALVGDSVWVTPGKYQFHDCQRLIDTEAVRRHRGKELEELMAKAAQSPGGQVVGTMAYRTEYQQTVGEQKMLAATIAEKRCRDDRESVSAQSVF